MNLIESKDKNVLAKNVVIYKTVGAIFDWSVFYEHMSSSPFLSGRQLRI